MMTMVLRRLDDFNLEVKRGEFVTFWDHQDVENDNTLRMIVDFEMPSSGKILPQW